MLEFLCFKWKALISNRGTVFQLKSNMQWQRSFPHKESMCTPSLSRQILLTLHTKEGNYFFDPHTKTISNFTLGWTDSIIVSDTE